MNPNKALWEKGDFTRIAQSMRESGEALVKELGITHGLDVLDLGCGDGTTALPAAMLGANVLGVDIAANLVEAGNKRALELGLDQLQIRGGRRLGPRGHRERGLRPRDEHLRRNVRSESLRRGQRGGPRDTPGGTHRHGELDTGRPDTGGADLENQFCILPTASRRFRESDDLGSRRERHRALHCSGSVRGADLLRPCYLHVHYPGTPSELLAQFRTYYGPTMNAFEAAAGTGKEMELQAELEALFDRQNVSPSKRRHLYPRHVLVRDGATVTATLSKGRSPRSRSRYDSVLSRTT